MHICVEGELVGGMVTDCPTLLGMEGFPEGGTLSHTARTVSGCRAGVAGTWPWVRRERKAAQGVGWCWSRGGSLTNDLARLSQVASGSHSLSSPQ